MLVARARAARPLQAAAAIAEQLVAASALRAPATPRQLHASPALRGALAASAPALERVLFQVPPMGDSITDGTVAQFVKGVGEAVAVDETVAIIETDKINVEIKSPVAGVIAELLAAEDDTVEVGADFIVYDTDAEAAAAAAAAPAATPEPAAAAAAPAPAPAPAAAPAAAAPRHRTPLIKFLGKRSLLPKGGAAAGPVGGFWPEVQHTPGALDPLELPEMFGRLPISEAEMEAIDSGGATVVW